MWSCGTRLRLILAAFFVGSGGSSGWGGEERVGNRSFTLPDGFELVQAAGPPLVDRPITMDFDEQGHLYVAESSGSNDPVEQQLAKRPHRILRLTDRDGDGIYDERTVFADSMMFPEGTLWHAGSLYVSAPPSIWKLTDDDGDGKADRREEWFEGKTLTGCANDLHGPYLGPDGWIYWCKGAFAEQSYDRVGGKPFVTRAAHLFRRSPRTGRVEPVVTGGMDNPVDITWTAGGEPIFSCTFLQHPSDGKRDGLIHAVYGGVYGKIHDVIEAHPRTQPEMMPVLSHLGPAAPCGLTRYESVAFGPEWRDNLFVTSFNLHTVYRVELTVEGASFQAAHTPFLSTTDGDFHPTDIQEDADGSLLVVDTGGWYKLCCPTSQLWKPDVLGAIYRVRRRGTAQVADPRGLKLDWKDASADVLCEWLGDARAVVRRRAVEQLGGLGARALPAIAETLRRSGSPIARREAVWASARIEGVEAQRVTRIGLNDAAAEVRLAALHIVSLLRDQEAFDVLIDRLEHATAAEQRVAAEALGRLGDPRAIPRLLAAVSATSDPIVRHAATYALIEIDDAEVLARALPGLDGAARLGALVALEQTGHSDPGVGKAVLELLSTAQADQRAAAYWLAGRHADWVESEIESLIGRVQRPEIQGVERENLARLIARASNRPAVAERLAARLDAARANSDEEARLLEILAQSELESFPRSWSRALARIVAQRPLTELQRRAVELAGQKRWSAAADNELLRAVEALALDTTAGDEIRIEALSARPAGRPIEDRALAELLLAQIEPEKPTSLRLKAASAIGRAAWTDEQRAAVLQVIPLAGPLELDRLLPAFEPIVSEERAIELMAALQECPAARGLSPDELRRHFEKGGPEIQRRLDDLIASWHVGLEEQREKVETLLKTLPEGDIRRGQAVFNGTKASCVACHSIGYLGGKIGPDLTRVGGIRSKRDLLEAVVFPSASFVRSYEPVLVALKDGQVLNGTIENDGASVLILRLNATERRTIPRDQIEEIRPSDVSIMPAGLDGQLSAQELADLLEFLQASK